MGIFARGVSDSVPKDYFIDGLNNKFGDSEVSSRDGSVLVHSASNIVRFYKYKRLGETPRYIYLDNAGNLYDSLYPNNPIYSDAAIVDFSCINYNNRLYITPHDRFRGIAGKSVIVYQGAGPATGRLAGGDPPTAFTMTASDGIAGSVEEGIHIIAVCYRTDTGYITAPSVEDLFVVYSAPGDKAIDLAGIPVSPNSYVNGRVLLATKSVPIDLFTGNLIGYEFFFIPDGTINDNTATTLTVDFFDADLEESADYLLDNLTHPKAGVFITEYGGRIVIGSANGEEHTIRMSQPGDPETFSSAFGLLDVNPSDSQSSVKNACEFRKSLILAKSNRLYITSDNGDDPTTWEVTSLDPTVGTECFGFCKTLDVKGQQADRLFIVDQSGLIDFDGVAHRPELTYNIEDIWKRINRAKFNLCQIVNDSTNHALYISVPLDSSTVISHVIYGDYSKAFTVYQTIDWTKIRWSLWQFAAAFTSIVADADGTTLVPVFEYAQSDGIYDVKAGLVNDGVTAIHSYVKMSLKTAANGWINHFGAMKARIVGNGAVTFTLTGEDNSNIQNPPGWTLTANPGYEPDRLINFINEKCAVKVEVNVASGRYTLSRFDLWAKPLWMRRAA